MPRTKDTTKDLRAALNQILNLVELVMPRPEGGALTDQEAPEYIVNRVRALAVQYQETKAFQAQSVALFKTLNRLDRLG
jgi:hypothetical protein